MLYRFKTVGDIIVLVEFPVNKLILQVHQPDGGLVPDQGQSVGLAGQLGEIRRSGADEGHFLGDEEIGVGKAAVIPDMGGIAVDDEVCLA